MAESENTYQFLSNPNVSIDAGKPEGDGSAPPPVAHGGHGGHGAPPMVELLGSETLSIGLVGPDALRRRNAADSIRRFRGAILREFDAYPASLDELPKLIEPNFDIIIIDLDANEEYALELVEGICAKSHASVMVYSAKVDPDLLMRCMRCGAREYLTSPIDPDAIGEALVRATARRSAMRPAKKAGGKLYVFLGAKGGAGVTTIACNFAVALAEQDPKQSTLLIDLDLPLGDAALNLGIVTEYSTINALQDAARLDPALLLKLSVKHSSGLTVLGAPGRYMATQATNEAIDKVVTVARTEFDNVIVDVGSRLDLTGTVLYKDAATIYLVTQTGIPELRNSNRLISQFFNNPTPKLDIVINRYEPRSLGVTDETIAKALTRPPQWKVPNDFPAVRRMQNTATPLTQADSPIARTIKQMAKAVAATAPGSDAAQPAKKKGFALFGK